MIDKCSLSLFSHLVVYLLSSFSLSFSLHFTSPLHSARSCLSRLTDLLGLSWSTRLSGRPVNEWQNTVSQHLLIFRFQVVSIPLHQLSVSQSLQLVDFFAQNKHERTDERTNQHNCRCHRSILESSSSSSYSSSSSLVKQHTHKFLLFS